MSLGLRSADEAGFSSVEIVFTLCILGLLTSMAVASIANVGSKMEQAAYLNLLSAELSLAQLEAISRQTPVEVKIDAANGFILVTQQRRCLRKLQIPVQYKLTSNYPGDAIFFQRTGQVRGGVLKLWQQGSCVGQIVIQVASGCPKAAFLVR